MSNMQRAQATRTITYVPSIGSLSAWLECSTGNLYQRYTDDAMSDVAPVFTPTAPCTVTMMVYNTQGGALAPARVMWRLGGVLLEFSSDGKSTGTYAGLFQIDPAKPVELKVIGNMAAMLGGVSSVLHAEAELVTNSLSASTVSAHMSVDIARASGASHYLSILSPDGLIITREGETLTLKAQAWEGLTEITTSNSAGYGVRWEKFDAASGTWSIVAASAWSLTVNESDVDSSALYRASLLKGTDPKVLATDYETVIDNQDPWWIEACPVPADETIVEGVNTGVTYTPVLMRKTVANPDGEAYMQGTKTFDFKLLDTSAGPGNEVVMSGNDALGQTSFTVSLNDVVTAGGSATLIISTEL